MRAAGSRRRVDLSMFRCAGSDENGYHAPAKRYRMRKMLLTKDWELWAERKTKPGRNALARDHPPLREFFTFVPEEAIVTLLEGTLPHPGTRAGPSKSLRERNSTSVRRAEPDRVLQDRG